MLKLRDYQIDQLDFLESKLDNSGGKPVFIDNIALESPTGSGKSVVLLEFVRRLFSEYSGLRVVISTGFNSLVDQFYEDAKSFGLPSVKLVGKGKCVCYDKLGEGDRDKYSVFNAFDSIPWSVRCISDNCYGCEFKSSLCLYNRVECFIREKRNVLVITNHSTMIAKKSFFEELFDIGFIDECQTFGDFYESSLRIDISPRDLRSLLVELKGNPYTRDNTLVKMFELNLSNGRNISKDFMKKIINLELLDNGREVKLKDKHGLVCSQIEDWINIEPGDDNYFYPTMNNDKFIGIKVERFFKKIDFKLNTCITSATIDTFTQNIFDIDKNNFYKETNANFINYKKSKLYFYNNFSMDSLKDFINRQTGSKGLLLSTRLDLIKTVKEELKIKNLEIVTKPDDINSDPNQKQLLIGSKSLFQGLNIPNINYIIINKIPFQRYDEVYKKKMRFFEKQGETNSYTFYTIPYTTNQLIQAMGRLWRNKDDYGEIAIFDKAAVAKHYYLIKNATNYRPGIKKIEMREYVKNEYTPIPIKQ